MILPFPSNRKGKKRFFLSIHENVSLFFPKNFSLFSSDFKLHYSLQVDKERKY